MITRVAWLYHTLGVRQSSIADRLNISQSRVSRLLEQAAHLGIVQTVVALPDDRQSAVEAELTSVYGLAQADVYSLGTVTDEAQLARELGQWLALQLQAAPPVATTIGYTSWSRSLQEMVQHLRPLPHGGTRFVVEMLGDLGPPVLQHQAAQHTQRLAALLGAEPVFLRLPGIVAHAHMRDTLLAHNSHAQEVLGRIDAVDLALVGVGSGAIVSPLRAGRRSCATSAPTMRSARSCRPTSTTSSSAPTSRNSGGRPVVSPSPGGRRNTGPSGPRWSAVGSTRSSRTPPQPSGSWPTGTWVQRPRDGSRVTGRPRPEGSRAG
jgi:DNA-binding transcriptional regulator LsrR (DeoR family)